MKVCKPNFPTINLLERETINGKPFGGSWIGSYILVNENIADGYREYLKQKLNDTIPSEFEIRYKQFIERSSNNSMFLNQNSSMAIKCMIWGRAYKVRRKLYSPKTKKKLKKMWVNGCRKTKHIHFNRKS